MTCVTSTGSGPASEIASQAGEDDFEDDTLVSTPEQQVMQVLVVQTQNEVTMAAGTPTTAPSTPTAALSTAPLTPVAGPSTMDSLNPIGAQLGAQVTPSVDLRAKPAICTDQTIVATQKYATLPHISSTSDTAPLASTPAQPYSVYIRHPRLWQLLCLMLLCLLRQQGLLYQWVIMVRAISCLYA